VHDKKESWKIFGHDDDICCFLVYQDEEVFESYRVVNLKHNVFPKGLTHLENMFLASDSSQNRTPTNEFSKCKIEEAKVTL
jgi:hypothetical protein